MTGAGYGRPERDARTRDQFPSSPSRPQEADTGAGGGSLPVCPSCGRADEVRAVQAVFLEGHRHVRTQEGAGDQRHDVTREVVSRLGRALAPAPPAPRVQGRGGLGVVLALVAAGTFLAGSLAGHWFGGDTGEFRPEYPYQGWNEAAPAPEAEFLFLGVISVIALLGAACLFAAVARAKRAYRARTQPGLAAAERLWIRGWYCGRCARVRFEGETAALTLQEFRVRVWTAGGYGDLAETHPAVDLFVAHRPDGSY